MSTFSSSVVGFIIYAYLMTAGWFGLCLTFTASCDGIFILDFTSVS
jgi:hypothetical protein